MRRKRKEWQKANGKTKDQDGPPGIWKLMADNRRLRAFEKTKPPICLIIKDRSSVETRNEATVDSSRHKAVATWGKRSGSRGAAA